MARLLHPILATEIHPGHPTVTDQSSLNADLATLGVAPFRNDYSERYDRPSGPRPGRFDDAPTRSDRPNRATSRHLWPLLGSPAVAIGVAHSHGIWSWADQGSGQEQGWLKGEDGARGRAFF